MLLLLIDQTLVTNVKRYLKLSSSTFTGKLLPLTTTVKRRLWLPIMTRRYKYLVTSEIEEGTK